MGRKLQIKRGLQADIPILSEGEFGLTTDQKKLYIGAPGGNVRLATEADISAVNNSLNTEVNLRNSQMLQRDINIYVSTTGNDTTGDGTELKPYKSIIMAITQLPNNGNGHSAIIKIGAGTYDEYININSKNGYYAILLQELGEVIVRGIKVWDCSNVQIGQTANISIIANSTWKDIGLSVYSDAVIALLKKVSGFEQGIHSGRNSVLTTNGGALDISNCNFAIIALLAGRFYHPADITGTNNKIGIYTDGGIVQLGVVTPSLQAQTRVTKVNGGLAIGGAGLDLI